MITIEKQNIHLRLIHHALCHRFPEKFDIVKGLDFILIKAISEDQNFDLHRVIIFLTLMSVEFTAY